MGKVLYIVDTSNWLHKFSCAYSLSREIGGVKINVSALYGVVKAIKASPFSDIMFVIDGTPEMSNTLLSSYKGQRMKEGEEVCRVKPTTIIKVAYSLGAILGKNVMIAVSPGQEADQVISSVVHIITGKAPSNWEFATQLNHDSNNESTDFRTNAYFEGAVKNTIDYSVYDGCVISTTDSDMYQLQSLGDVIIDTSTNGSKLQLQVNAPVAVSNVECSAIVGYKMILGDKSDNVPKLQIPMKKDKIISIVNKDLNSLEKCKNFITRVKLNSLAGMSEDLKLLASQIIENKQQSVLRRNFEVVALVFTSAPYILSYPSYRVMDVLNKYRIRI